MRTRSGARGGGRRSRRGRRGRRGPGRAGRGRLAGRSARGSRSGSQWSGTSNCSRRSSQTFLDSARSSRLACSCWTISEVLALIASRTLRREAGWSSVESATTWSTTSGVLGHPPELRPLVLGQVASFDRARMSAHGRRPRSSPRSAPPAGAAPQPPGPGPPSTCGPGTGRSLQACGRRRGSPGPTRTARPTPRSQRTAHRRQRGSRAPGRWPGRFTLRPRRARRRRPAARCRRGGSGGARPGVRKYGILPSSAQMPTVSGVTRNALATSPVVMGSGIVCATTRNLDPI